MNKTINELTREELLEIAADYEIEGAEKLTDDELHTAVDKALDEAEPVKPEDLDGMTRDQLIELAAGIGYKHQSNIGEDKLREKLKVELAEMYSSGETVPNNTATPESSAKPAAKIGAKTIEAWAAELRTPSWQFAAAMQANKWAAGKSLTKEQYQTGLQSLNRPIGGR